jgi:hypothetical protein
MPRTTGVFVKRRAKRVAKTRRRKRTRKLTNRKLKDIVSRKKRDTMCGWSPHDSANNPLPTPVRGLEFGHRPNASDNPHFNLWCASYRQLGIAAFDTTRNTQRVFVKGLKDTYRLEIQNAPWEWRRLVFSTHTRYVGGNAQSATYLPNNSFGAKVAANSRVVGQGTEPGQPAINLEGTSTGIDAFDDIFRGQRGVDWNSYFTAPPDTNLIKVFSDKKFRIASGNESGAAKVKKFYTPINKTIVYDDEEQGTDQVTNGWVSQACKTGNIYVLDMFWNETGADTTFANMRWNAEATFYWHES